MEYKKFDEIIIYDVKVGDIIKEYNRSGYNNYSKVYKITKSYIFLESYKPIDIKIENFNQCDRETTYFLNFTEMPDGEKRKIFMRKPDPRHKPQTLHKLKDNNNFVIDKYYYCSD